MSTPYARLVRWRDVGDGPVAYTAGDGNFGADVIALLKERDDMLTALQAIQRDGREYHGDIAAGTHELVDAAITKATGAQP